jgi:hypothetical protein
MAPQSVRFGVRSRNLINVGHRMGDQKFYLELLRASGATLIKLVPAAFAVVSTHQPALGPRGGLWPVLLMCNP